MKYSDLVIYQTMVDSLNSLQNTLNILQSKATLDSFQAVFKDLTDINNVQTYEFSMNSVTMDPILLAQVVALFTANVQTQIKTLQSTLSQVGITVT